MWFPIAVRSARPGFGLSLSRSLTLESVLLVLFVLALLSALGPLFIGRLLLLLPLTTISSLSVPPPWPHLFRRHQTLAFSSSACPLPVTVGSQE